ncbi:MAG: UDP-2,4-diacetamido-2,4,6-trideoxy-beta-L-altropyranose hydrolase [Bacillota bacterium]
MINIVFRVDASVQMGSGHVMRSLTLAGALRERDAHVSFICRRELPGDYCDFIETKGYEVYRLPAGGQTIFLAQDDLYARWLGVDREQDAEQTKVVLSNMEKPVDWLIIDHYSLSRKWETEIRPYVDKIMVIDDLANRSHDCDILLDQNIHDDLDDPYDGLVPAGCLKLLGPRYALLRPEFRKFRENIRAREGTPNRILVFLGGSDPDDITSKVLKNLQLINRPELEVDVVVGGANPHKEKVKRACEALPRANFFFNIDNIAELISRADLAVGAGGSSTWERCCLGLPTLGLSLSPNQEILLQGAAQAGVAVDLGPSSQITSLNLAQKIENLFPGRFSLRQMSEKGMRLVDGLGVERVIRKMGIANRVTLISDAQSWINQYIPILIGELVQGGHTVLWVQEAAAIPKGDFLFCLGYGRVIPPGILSRNRHNLVIHESDLPRGKGWSPLTWMILEGANEIPIVLFEAAESIDSGKIYLREKMNFRGMELIDELRRVQAETSIKMCLKFIGEYPELVALGIAQEGESTYCRRRTNDDSRIDPDKTIREQFNLLRVVDNQRYPAFFEIDGHTFILKIERKPECKVGDCSGNI